MEGVAFQIEDCVHDVFEHLGPGDGALFGDVSHEQHRRPALLGPSLQARGAFAHLAHASRRRIQVGDVRRLDGVHNQGLQRRLRLRLDQHGVHLRLRQHQHRLAPQVEAARAELDLAGRFLARDVQHGTFLRP